MSSKFEMIPCIYAGSLPRKVSEELSDWSDELCLHGDGGCVFTIRDFKRLPLFKAWLIEVGIITQEDLDQMPSLEKYCNEIGITIGSATSQTFIDYRKYKGDRKEFIKIAMQGT
jgi:hypothetical protein